MSLLDAGDVVGRDIDQRATLEKRAVRVVVTASALKYRDCPRTDCTAYGQYASGTVVYANCYVDGGTTVVNGDP